MQQEFLHSTLIDLLFEHLDIQEMFTLSQVCQQWRSKLDDNDCYMWLLKCKQLWPAPWVPRTASSALFSSIKHYMVIRGLMLNESERFRRALRKLLDSGELSQQQLKLFGIDLDAKNPLEKAVDFPVKRAKSAYMYFCERNRDRMMQAMPGDQPTKVMKALATEWKALADTAKQPYEALAAADRQRYVEQRQVETVLQPVLSGMPTRSLEFKEYALDFFKSKLRNCVQFGHHYIRGKQEIERSLKLTCDSLCAQLDNGNNIYLTGVHPENRYYWIFPRDRDPMNPLVLSVQIEARPQPGADLEDNEEEDEIRNLHLQCLTLPLVRGIEFVSDLSVINAAIVGPSVKSEELAMLKLDQKWLSDFFVGAKP